MSCWPVVVSTSLSESAHCYNSGAHITSCTHHEKVFVHVVYMHVCEEVEHVMTEIAATVLHSVYENVPTALMYMCTCTMNLCVHV